MYASPCCVRIHPLSNCLIRVPPARIQILALIWCLSVRVQCKKMRDGIVMTMVMMLVGGGDDGGSSRDR